MYLQYSPCATRGRVPISMSDFISIAASNTTASPLVARWRLPIGGFAFGARAPELRGGSSRLPAAGEAPAPHEGRANQADRGSSMPNTLATWRNREKYSRPRSSIFLAGPVTAKDDHSLNYPKVGKASKCKRAVLAATPARSAISFAGGAIVGWIGAAARRARQTAT
jgi:hypothetical protein